MKEIHISTRILGIDSHSVDSNDKISSYLEQIADENLSEYLSAVILWERILDNHVFPCNYFANVVVLDSPMLDISQGLNVFGLSKGVDITLIDYGWAALRASQILYNTPEPYFVAHYHLQGVGLNFSSWRGHTGLQSKSLSNRSRVDFYHCSSARAKFQLVMRPVCIKL